MSIIGILNLLVALLLIALVLYLVWWILNLPPFAFIPVPIKQILMAILLLLVILYILSAGLPIVVRVGMLGSRVLAVAAAALAIARP